MCNIYLDFSKAFDSYLVAKLKKYELDGWTTRWMKNSQDYSLTIEFKGQRSRLWILTSSKQWVSCSGQYCNWHCLMSSSTVWNMEQNRSSLHLWAKPNWGGMSGVLNSRAAIPQNLEEWLNRNPVTLSKDKCQILLLRQSIPWHQYKLVTDWLVTALQKTSSGSWWMTI